MRVRFSRHASKDLISILADLAAKDPSAPHRFEARIRQLSERLGQYPNSFQELTDRPCIRRAPLQRYPYLLFYEVVAGEVIILRIMHGARKNLGNDL
jgi:plasmid stabilization system protein ParE